MYTPIEGQDWIFDRYAFLGLEPDASDKDIAAAIRKKIAENHPDRVTHLGENLQAEAARTRRLIKQVVDILTVPEQKVAFDALLRTFKDANLKLVSVTGNPIISVGRERIDLDILSKPEDDRGVSTVQQMMAAQFPDNSEILQGARGLYESRPDGAKPIARNIYRQELLKRLEHLRFKEQSIFTMAGFHNANVSGDRIQHSDEYAGCIEDLRARVASSIPKVLDVRLEMKSIGFQVPKLLEDSQSSQSSQEDEAEPLALAILSKEEVVEKLRDAFIKRTEQLAELAKEIEQTLQEILQLTEHGVIKEAVGKPKRIIAVMMLAGDRPVAAWQIDLDTNACGFFEEEVYGHSLEEIATFWKDSDLVYRVEHDEQAFPSNLLMESIWVLEKVADEVMPVE